MFDSNGTTFEGLSTGLTHLDEKLQGLKASEMVVIAARPSVGKTSLAMNIAESCALGLDMNNAIVRTDGGKRHPVMIFSLEMPVEALTKRMLAGRAHINMWRLNRNLCARSEKKMMFENLSRAADELNAQIAKLKGENEELRRGLRESEENVEYWRKHYDQAVRKYAEAVADENNQ